MVQSISNTGLLRPNKYTVLIDYPQLLATDSRFADVRAAEAQADLAVRISRIGIPASNLETAEMPSDARGTTMMVRRAATWDALAFELVLSEDARERIYFERWVELIHGRSTGFTPLFYQNYIASRATVNLISDTAGPILAYKFFNIFPTAVGDIELSYGDTDGFGTCAITMNYETMQSYNIQA